MGLETFWTFIWSARFFEMTAQDDTRSVYRVSSGPRRNHVKKGPWCQVVDNGDVCNTSGAIATAGTAPAEAVADSTTATTSAAVPIMQIVQL